MRNNCNRKEDNDTELKVMVNKDHQYCSVILTGAYIL